MRRLPALGYWGFRWCVARPASLALGAVGVSLAVLVLSPWGLGHKFGLLDLSVYRDGSGDVLGSGDLYQDTFGSYPLPFTYPPAAAIALVPLRVLGLGQVGLVWTGVSLGFLLLMVYVACAAASAGRLDSGSLWAVVLSVFAVALWLEPVQSTLSLGQINLILDGLVIFDLCCRVGWVPSGSLVGLAAAIKLVPLFFIVYLLVVRRTRAAGTALSTFAMVTLMGWLLAPGASKQYWTGTVFNTDRIGSPQYVANQSLHGVIVRVLGVEDSAIGTVLWVGSALVTAIWGLSLAVRLDRLHGALPGVLTAACTSLLVAPTSWSHYYVWIAPITALMVMVHQAIPIPYRITVLLCVLVFFAQPIWWLPYGHNAEFHYTMLQQLLASSYVIATLGLLAVAEVWTHRGATWNDRRFEKAALAAAVRSS